MNELAPEAAGREEPSGRGPRRPGVVRPRRAPARSGGFGLRVYKPGQGYYTRTGTAIGVGVLIVAGAVFLLNELGALSLSGKYLFPVQYGVTTGFIAAMAVLLYWIAGINRRANDFFIATEGEMKKVSWSTRKEVVRSTKVVIVTVILLGVFLFAADLLFMLFFSTIKVLKGSPGLDQIFGSGS